MQIGLPSFFGLAQLNGKVRMQVPEEQAVEKASPK
jgi:hypothetical protein